MGILAHEHTHASGPEATTNMLINMSHEHEPDESSGECTWCFIRAGCLFEHAGKCKRPTFFENGRQPHFFGKCKMTSIFLKEDNFNFVINGRQPYFCVNGRQVIYFFMEDKDFAELKLL